MSEGAPNPPTSAEPLSTFERFLGPGILPGDPLSLLGTRSVSPNESEVLAALQRRLAQLGGHPEATSAQGSEVRFALHAAAAKLVDAAERERNPAQATPPAIPRHELDALGRALAMGEGLSAASLQQAAALASAYRLDVPTVLRQAMGSTAAGGTEQHSRVEATTRLPPPGPLFERATGVMEPPAGVAASESEADPARRLLLAGAWFIGGLMALLMALTAVIVVVARMPGNDGSLSGPGEVASPKHEPEDPATTTSPAAPPVIAAASPARPKAPAANRVEEWADLVRELDGVASLLRSGETGAVEAFERVHPRIAARWTAASPDERSAALNGIVEALYAAKDDPIRCEPLVRAIALPAVEAARGKRLAVDEVWPAVWSAGAVARLSSERDLPRAIVRQIDDLASEAFDAGGPPAEASFEAGAASALLAATARLIPMERAESDPSGATVTESWRRWLAASAALRGPESELHQHLMLTALDRLMTSAPEPTVNPAVLEAITTVASALTWRQEDASRRWLLRAFDSKAVSSADLFAVTSAIATRSGAQGVDQTMVLPAGALEAARAALRDQYASVWGVASAEARDEAVEHWAASAQQALAADEPDRSPIQSLVRAVSLARLNAAASLIWSGAPDEAATVLADLDSGLSTRLANLVGAGPPQPLGRGLSNWALQYLPLMQAGGRFAERRKLLQEFQGMPNRADARIMVEEACRGGHDGVRTDAQALVKKLGSDPAVVNALLDEAPSMPPTVSCTALVSAVTLAQIPPPRDGGWRVAVRRALVERLLELLAGRSDRGLVDEASVVLAETYQLQTPQTNTQGPGDPGGPIRMAAPPPVESAASAVRAGWLREAEALVPTGKEPVSLAAAASARAARARIAQGRVQVFAACQADICDLMAFVISAERTGRAAPAAGLLADLAAQRRTARHIFQQIEASERTTLRLWLLRFGLPETGGPS